MKNTNQSNGRGIAMTAIIATAVGAGVALLFAPGSGKQTRGWLTRTGRKLSQGTSKAYSKGKDVIQRAALAIGADGEASTKHPKYARASTSSTRR